MVICLWVIGLSVNESRKNAAIFTFAEIFCLMSENTSMLPESAEKTIPPIIYALVFNVLQVYGIIVLGGHFFQCSIYGGGKSWY